MADRGAGWACVRSSSAPTDNEYASTAFVPPKTVDTGLASFVLRGFEAGAPRSSAQGRWLFPENIGDQSVMPRTIVVVTEGTQVVVSAVEVVERRVKVPVPVTPARRDWPGLLEELARQIEDGRVYKRDLLDLSDALNTVLESYPPPPLCAQWIGRPPAPGAGAATSPSRPDRLSYDRARGTAGQLEKRRTLADA